MGGSCSPRGGKDARPGSSDRTGGLRPITSRRDSMRRKRPRRAAFCRAALGVEEVVQVQGRAEPERPGLLWPASPVRAGTPTPRPTASFPGEETSTDPPDLGRAEAFLALLPVDLRVVEQRRALSSSPTSWSAFGHETFIRTAVTRVLVCGEQLQPFFICLGASRILAPARSAPGRSPPRRYHRWKPSVLRQLRGAPGDVAQAHHLLGCRSTGAARVQGEREGAGQVGGWSRARPAAACAPLPRPTH